MKSKKAYSPIKLTQLGNVEELTQLGLGKSGPDTDGMNGQGNMNFVMFMNMDMNSSTLNSQVLFYVSFLNLSI